MSGFPVSIHNINLGECEQSVDRYAPRLGNIADKVASDLSHPWDLIGLNECSAKVVGTVDVHYEKRTIPCRASGKRLLSVECFDAHLRNGKATDIVFQGGECGVVASSQKFELADFVVRHALLGNRLPNTKRRDVVGSRLRIKGEGYALPFYSTHISYYTGFPPDQARVQLEHLVKKIRGWWIKGDLTPVVVGDFNSHGWGSKHWSIMKYYFEQVKGELEGKIEHVWIGKRHRFRGSCGNVTVNRTDRMPEYDDDAVSLTNHGVSYVEIAGPEERFLGNIHHKEVHDLDYRGSLCQINEIIAAGHARHYASLRQAHQAGYDNCIHCIGNSRR